MEDNKNSDKNKKLRKRIMMIVIIIIIILSLITSCSCTSKYLGKIGDKFNNEGNVDINPDSNDKEEVLNKDLLFDSNYLEMYLSDKFGSITFTYKNINPNKITCYTSNSDIATCYVKDDYVVINPKMVGNITVTIEADTNGKIYKSTAEVEIKNANKYISLSSNEGTINLAYNKERLVSFILVGIKGNVKVKISDESVASVKVVGKHIVITGKKSGNTTITVYVEDNGKTYSTSYNLKVVNNSSTNNNENANKPNVDNESNKKDSNSLLKSLKVSKGSLDFKENIFSYYLSVPNDVDKLTFDATLASDKSIVKYTLNGKTVDSLNDLPLNVGENKLSITVVAEDGSTSTYDVTINRSKSSSSSKESGSLKSLSVSEGKLTPSFQENIKDYYVSVDSSVKDIDVKGFPKEDDDKVRYKVNGKVYEDGDNLPLNDGDNKIEIEIEDKNGNKSSYTVNVHKSKRTIEFEQDKYVLDVLEDEYEIVYRVYEDGKEIDASKINLEEILASIPEELQGYVEVYQGYIKVKTNPKFGNKFFNLELESNGAKAKITLEFKEESYFLNPQKESYDLSFVEGNNKRNLGLRTNIFKNGFNVEKTDKGIILRDKTNKDNYIELEYNDEEFNIDNIVDGNPLLLEVEAKKNGKYNLHVKGCVNGEVINEFDIEINISENYILILDANGGYFDEFTTQYEFRIDPENNVFDLSEYEKGYFTSDDCLNYAFDYFIDKDTNINYSKTIEVTKNTTLLAVYKKEALEDAIEEERTLYLSDVDIFYNEEYFKEYGIKNVVFPGSEGSYIMRIDNNTGKDITITKLRLKEDNICQNNSCLNMGYVLKDYKNKYYLGSNNEYVIINNKKVDTEKEVPINLKLKNKESTEISILWKWVEINDEEDTLIGIEAAKGNNEYKVTISFDFTISKDDCEVNP